ncbi:hypothetical protein HII31_11551 [Pseudocercospora fuligena]|uniref:Uncharacterized protein n=1 Tax=Pseudocercospora fuligena TaxID=685502 RepID=A0A8H6R8C0_9PEZI|nr:hypothetical protein HII31_11551 [Pseudocercospora fuligena]
MISVDQIRQWLLDAEPVFKKLDKEVEDHEQKVLDLSKQLKAVQSDSVKKQKTVDEFQEKLAKLEEERDSFKTKYYAATTLHDQNQKTIDEYQEKLIELEEERDSFKTKYHEAKECYAQGQKEQRREDAQRDEQIKQLQRKCNDFEQRLEAAEATTLQAGSEAEEARYAVDRVRNDVEQVKQAAAELSKPEFSAFTEATAGRLGRALDNMRSTSKRLHEADGEKEQPRTKRIRLTLKGTTCEAPIALDD